MQGKRRQKGNGNGKNPYRGSDNLKRIPCQTSSGIS
jgi:hypothetical protein